VDAGEVAAHGDSQAGAATAARLFGQLQSEAVEDDDVVAPDRARFLMAKQLIEIRVAQRGERTRRIGGRAGELGVVVGDELLAQVGIGRLEGGDARDAELVDQPSLQGAVQALDPTAGLGV
jgi:hypothetical protein